MASLDNGQQHDSKNARRAEHDLDHHLQHGESLQHAFQDEVHKLRHMDSRHGHLNNKKFHRDLQELKKYADHKHLPHLHLDHGHAAVHHGQYHNSADSSTAAPAADTSAGSGRSHPGRRSDVSSPAPNPAASPSDTVAPPRNNPADSAVWKPPVAPPSLDRVPAGRQLQQQGEVQQPGATDNLATQPPTDGSAPQLVDGQNLRAAIDRARAGGRPLQITQIGDSHIAFGQETPAIASKLAQDAGLAPGQVTSSEHGEVGKTAQFADQNSDRFLQNVNANTDLVVLSFGSNEATAQVGSAYAHDYADLVAKIRQKAPHAAIAMVGPTDGNFWNSDRHLPGLDSVINAQSQVAGQVPDSTYVNVQPQMGSLADMQRHGFVRSDRLHLTPQGYEALGSIVADDIYKNINKL